MDIDERNPMNPHSIGDRVSWRREVYRMAYAKRPVDHGTVVALDGLFVQVRADHDGQAVRGAWVVFSKLNERTDS